MKHSVGAAIKQAAPQHPLEAFVLRVLGIQVPEALQPANNAVCTKKVAGWLQL